MALLAAAGACREPVDTQPAPGRALYFDVPAYIGRQAALLARENPGAQKSVQENRQDRESKTLHHLNWQKELAIFAELDLNKPALRNAYTVSRQAAANGLVTETYRKKPGTEGDITFLSVTTGPDRQVRALQARRENDNPLISSRQDLALSCSPQAEGYRIRSFRIAGRQAPVIFDSLQYLIITEIR
jgi:hypothetical protein